MNPDKIWAHCPRCKSTQRFERVQMNHRFHAALSVLTLGLWGVSWLAGTIWHRFWPWQCKNCGSNEPGDSTNRQERSKASIQ